jgi:periplasmic protein TonB
MKSQDRVRFGGAMGASLAFHAGLLLLLLTILTAPRPDSSEPPALASSLTYIHAAGVGGGGGGGSNQPRVMPTPALPEPSVAQPETMAPPIPPSLSLTATPHPPDLPGAITGLSTPGSPAPGNPGGGGPQPGRGAGEGTGDGEGPGKGGNTGGDEYAPGGNVTIPEVLVEVRPAYTTEAMRAKIQGIVVIEAVVLADGTLARPLIVRSLDPGLNRRALEAVQQWRFKPGRRRDTNDPVNVRVTIQLTFSLR